MRKAAESLLLLFVFTIPWEYSLDLGAPFGNIARITGLVLLLVAVPAVLQAGRMRKPRALQWLTLALYLWFCCSYFWSATPEITTVKLRGYFQEMMLVWLIVGMVNGIINWTWHPCCGTSSGPYTAAWGTAINTVPGSNAERDRGKPQPPQILVRPVVCVPWFFTMVCGQ